MNLSQDILREELGNYVKEKGVKKTHIARELGVSPTTVNLFIKGERELSQSNLIKIYNIINS